MRPVEFATTAAVCAGLLVTSMGIGMARGASGGYADFVPEPGFTTTIEETPPDTELVKRLFALGYTDQCSMAIGGSALALDPEVWDLTYRDSYQDAEEPDRSFRLYRFDCDAGAYNIVSVFLTWDSFAGLAPLSFAQPEFEVSYENGDYDGKVLDIVYKGMSATNRLVNAWFDPETRTIGATARWRGLGDASSTGRWVQSGPAFVLDTFDVDASYDEAINPWRLVAGARLLAVPELLPEERFDDLPEDAADGQ